MFLHALVDTVARHRDPRLGARVPKILPSLMTRIGRLSVRNSVMEHVVGAAFDCPLVRPPTDGEVALGALSSGVCGSVYLDPHLQWDSHPDNGLQDGCWNDLFTLLQDLARSLENEDLLDHTLVVVISEMGIRWGWR